MLLRRFACSSPIEGQSSILPHLYAYTPKSRLQRPRGPELLGSMVPHLHTHNAPPIVSYLHTSASHRLHRASRPPDFHNSYVATCTARLKTSTPLHRYSCSALPKLLSLEHQSSIAPCVHVATLATRLQSSRAQHFHASTSTPLQRAAIAPYLNTST